MDKPVSHLNKVYSPVCSSSSELDPPVQPEQARLLLKFTAHPPSQDIPSPWEPTPMSRRQPLLQRIAAEALCPLMLVLHQDLQ